MDLYITIEKRHSENKKKDYITGVLHIGDQEKFITLDKETQLILLDMKPTELYCIPNGFVSKKIKLVIE